MGDSMTKRTMDVNTQNAATILRDIANEISMFNHTSEANTLRALANIISGHYFVERTAELERSLDRLAVHLLCPSSAIVAGQATKAVL